MRFTLGIALLICFPIFAQADDQPKPNTLTPKEIADGWILLFDGKSTYGWTSPNDSKWTIADGMLAPQKDKPGLLVTTTAFRNYLLVVDFQLSKTGNLEVLPFCNAQGEGGQVLDLGANPRFREGRWECWIGVEEEAVRSGSFHSRVKKFVGFEEPFKQSSTRRPTQPCNIGLRGNRFIIHSIKLKPATMEQLLIDKDLKGWKEFPGRKSKFSVTQDGFLHVKDGPGDLQTAGEWADFILQLDCKTNGKNLNSGIFFRCLPGEYQMGYEAQIHNGFGPDKEYTLDIHDPKTQKLVERKKEKFAAIDYGTGAIYRRMPARFQAANDNEWFTMTVAAQGRHLATWVNGIQTVDWTDHRPLDENARKGAYLKKGPISIQGHDPTTDLLFRNFRLAELPAK